MLKMIIQQGAEAILSTEYYQGETILKKDRLVKGYRIPALDKKIRKERTQLEERILIRARRAGVMVPRVIDRDQHILRLEYIEGTRIKELLQQVTPAQARTLGKEIGNTVRDLHMAGIIHGDLTTSNMIFSDKLYLIDFGLAKLSVKNEDRGVDLYLFSEALKAANYRISGVLWKTFLKAYSQHNSSFTEIKTKIDQIATRRRYK